MTKYKTSIRESGTCFTIRGDYLGLMDHLGIDKKYEINELGIGGGRNSNLQIRKQKLEQGLYNQVPVGLIIPGRNSRTTRVVAWDKRLIKHILEYKK